MHHLFYLLSTTFPRVQTAVSEVMLAPGSTFSAASLISALLLAAGFIAFSRWRRRGRVSLRLLGRALWPRRAAFAASGKTDAGFFLLNTFCVGGLIGWGLLSQAKISDWTAQALTGEFGAGRWRLDGGVAAVVTTLLLFLTYDLAYWFDHWLSHRVPALWELHKVHHTAEALTPLTNFRVHPLESLHFYNVVAISTGLVGGALFYLFGGQPGHVMLFGADALFFAFTFTILHLQHTHVWIAFRGVAGRLFLSPAHHQIHHSRDERHFGSNLGSALAIWDWAFGTLYVPAAQREPLAFGVDGQTEAAHSITGTLITPVLEAAQVLRRPSAASARPSQGAA